MHPSEHEIHRQGIGLVLHYQWQYNGVNMAGATNSSLTIPNIQTANEGSYRVVISNGAGTVISDTATLAIIRPIPVPSLPCTNWIQSAFTLCVTSSCGTSLYYPGTYQWYSNGVAVSVLTNQTLTYDPQQTPPTAAETDFSVSISNSAGVTNFGPWRIYAQLPGMSAVWGANNSGQASYPILTNTLDVAAGESFCVAALDTGNVVQWGLTNSVVPVNATNIVAVAAGARHILALTANNTVIAWGTNNAGQITIPSGLTNVVAVSAGGDQSLALRTDGTVVQWGSQYANIPPTLTGAKVAAIASGINFHLALLTNGSVAAWGNNSYGQITLPASVTNITAIAASGSRALALRTNGSVASWGSISLSESNSLNNLTNAMGIAAGYAHVSILKNDATVLSFGDCTSDQTNVPVGLSTVKKVAAGASNTIAAVFSPLVQYPIDVSRDLLLIYNTNSAMPDSLTVFNYYMQHRPMISGANTLAINCRTNTQSPDNDTISRAIYTSDIQQPILQWLNANPTKRPQYWVLFPDLPARINNYGYGYYSTDLTEPLNGCDYSVDVDLHSTPAGIHPFITHINMRNTNDCIAYIKKLEFFGTNYSPGKLLISARGYGSTNHYSNTNYYIDETKNTDYGTGVSIPMAVDYSNAVLFADARASIVYTDAPAPYYGTLAGHLTNCVNVAAYVSWGYHGYNGNTNGAWAINQTITFSGSSAWYPILNAV
jgi:hypothetical protein